MFSSHILNANGKKEVESFKWSISKVASEVMELMPEGRDKSIFVTKLEEAVFFGTRAIAHKADNYTEIVDY